MARIAVAATAPFGADVLERLAAHHEIAALLTRPDAPAGRGRRLAAPPAATAERLGDPRPSAGPPGAGLELGAPTVVVCAYGLLIPPALLTERTWLSVHPSLLPRWRGAAPGRAGDRGRGRGNGCDDPREGGGARRGPIATVAEFPIGREGRRRCQVRPARPRSPRLLDGVLADPAPTFRPQRASRPTREDHGPDDRRLDLARPVEELVRVVRALSPHRRAGGARGAPRDRVACPGR